MGRAFFNEKHNLFENEHPSRAPGPFWPNRLPRLLFGPVEGAEVRRSPSDGGHLVSIGPPGGPSTVGHRSPAVCSRLPAQVTDRAHVLRKLAATTGHKGPRNHSRGPIQNKLLKQQVVVLPPSEPAMIGSSSAEDLAWMDGASLEEALPKAPAHGGSPARPIQEPKIENGSEPKVCCPW